MEKRCSTCRETKAFDQFGKSKGRKGGLHPVCRACRKLEARRPDYQRSWYEENRETVLARAAENQKTNKPRRRAYLKIYYQQNKHLYMWRMLVRRSVKDRQGKRTAELLGYSCDDLKLHLERLFTPGMTWENHGEWHVDHIKDIATFPPDALASEVNALSNLRPLWKTSRVIDGVFYEGNLNRPKFVRKRHV